MSQPDRIRSSTITILLIIIASVVAWLFLPVTSTKPAAIADPLTISVADNDYLGSANCAGCHSQAYQEWQGSHHDMAMQHATPATIKGNFDNAVFSLPTSHTSAEFFTRQDGFYARLKGIDGKLEEYKILYTFGTEPLQQYLVAFPDGRLQQLPVAWNTLTQQWFDPQPELKAQPSEWVHWTEGGKNWNSMCADCHSTAVEKNFDLTNNSYTTRVAEIDVGCESCHGPGKHHVETVSAATFDPSVDNLQLKMLAGDNPQWVVDQCGRCHARRQMLTAKFEHNSNNLLDHYLPTLINPPNYHSDGQILDEVFVYGSFVQSKMYQAGVSCLDCHQPHSGKLKAEGNQLCGSCHQSDQFDTPQHHQHSKDAQRLSIGAVSGTGAQCIDCHMPGRLYMGNDYRRDHSFRIPRPDLTVAHNTPNACNDCHSDQSAEWAAASVESWFGPDRPAHFSDILTQAHSQPDQSIQPLVTLINDVTQPTIARATAVSLLAPTVSLLAVESAIINASSDPNALLRTIAAQSLDASTNKLAPLLLLLEDPVRAVRIAAAQALADVPEAQIPAAFTEAYKSANQEYQTSLMVNADFPSGRLQMAVDEHRRSNLDKAAERYRETLSIDGRFNAARMNLAQLYYSQQQLDKAEQLYRTVIDQEPQASEAHYSLGLLMAEKGDYKEAASALKQAAISGNNPRAWYNLAILYQQSGQSMLAEQAYLKALELRPKDAQFINGLVSLYGQQQRWFKAKKLIDRALTDDPANRHLLQLKGAVEQRLGN